MAQRSDALGGAEAYPFDPNVRAEYQRDLDRLRGFADRKLAAYLFELYTLAASNSAKPQRAATAETTAVEVARDLARRAFAGQLGPDARELAEALLLDQTGRERADEQSVRTFARAYQALKRG
jgi:hypothetical protein